MGMGRRNTAQDMCSNSNHGNAPHPRFVINLEKLLVSPSKHLGIPGQLGPFL